MQHREWLGRPALWLLVACFTTVVAYWIGLRGPFLLDDAPNLVLVKAWQTGNATLAEVALNNTSLLTHRALSMLSFAASAAIHGYDPFGFKLDNLALHLVCGTFVFILLSHLLRRDRQLASSARWIALFIAVVWLLHPFNASTVLYTVQRMAQWAMLVCLLGLLLYLAVRTRLEQGDGRWSIATLFVAFPTLVFLGIQGKQNAAALPLLCLVLELGYFQPNPRKWPLTIKVFFGVFLAMPAFLATAVLLVKPAALLAGYGEYEFSPGQRLLSEARVMFDYIQQLIFPHTPTMGVFTDNYVASTGLFSPPSTALCILMLLAISALAVYFRVGMPGFFTGWFFFLAAHMVEGTVLPLELYYEHRNYLPSIGIFLAGASLIAAIGRALAGRGIRIGRIGAVCGFALVLTLALQTHGRARVWSDPFVLLASELSNNPESARVVAYNIGTAVTAGDIDYAYQVVNQTIERTHIPRLRGQAMLLRIWLDCMTKGTAKREDLDFATESLPAHIDLNTFVYLDQVAGAGECGEIDSAALADALVRITDRASQQPDDLNLKWALRNRTAFLYAHAGRWDAALLQARKGWQPSTPGDGAAGLVEIYLVMGQLEEAEHLLKDAIGRAQGDPDALQELEKMWKLIEMERNQPGFNRQRVGYVPRT